MKETFQTMLEKVEEYIISNLEVLGKETLTMTKWMETGFSKKVVKT